MHPRLWARLDLRRLILLLAVVSALVMLANAFHAAYSVQRELLIEDALNANQAYSSKLAATTDDYLRQAQRQLAYGAAAIASAVQAGSSRRIALELDRMRWQADIFNSVTFVTSEGRIELISPANPSLRGQKLDNPASRESLETRRPIISEPYVSLIGNLMIVLTHPVETEEGLYLGYISGTIYLRQQNMLHELLEDHFHLDNSYVYVIDRSRRLLYHPDRMRIGSALAAHPVADVVLLGSTGQKQFRNTEGEEMLAGYAFVPTAGWGIVTQRPAQSSVDRVDLLMRDVLRRSVWPALVLLLLVWVAARLISAPLGGLARIAREMDAPEAYDKIERVNSWYFEATQLKRAMLAGIGLLQLRIGRLRQDAQTDALTGLTNRRGLDLVIETWQTIHEEFSVGLLDIDHFKRVNDEFGHDVGDRVLQRLAAVMREQSRDGDVLCRLGGEEFLVMWPRVGTAEARASAERLRQAVAAADMGLGRPVTISIGLAAWPRHGDDFSAVLKAADEAMYRAKAAGRNRVESA